MIRNIIFDLGGVLLDLDKDRSINSFVKLGWNADDVRYVEQNGLAVFGSLETGAEQPAQFRDKIRTTLPGHPTDQEIDDAWNAMLLGFAPGIIEYLDLLRPAYNLYLLSNTNTLHQRRFRGIFYTAYGYLFDDLFVKTYYSHEIGYRKPDPRTYLKVIREESLNRKETLFVDDTSENTEAAEILGLQVLLIKPGTLLDVLPACLSSNLRDDLPSYIEKLNNSR